MENKNAYEIRLEILHMAHQDCQQKFNEIMGSISRIQDRSSTPEILTKEKLYELYPTTTEIITRAEELYKFVANNK